MYKLKELKEIHAEKRTAVAATCAYGGCQIEAFRDDTRSYIVMTKSKPLFAMITIDQFNSLSRACDWENCGAQSADDANITIAAIAWAQARELVWHKIGRGDRMVPMSVTGLRMAH